MEHLYSEAPVIFNSTDSGISRHIRIFAVVCAVTGELYFIGGDAALLYNCMNVRGWELYFIDGDAAFLCNCMNA